MKTNTNSVEINNSQRLEKKFMNFITICFDECKMFRNFMCRFGRELQINHKNCIQRGNHDCSTYFYNNKQKVFDSKVKIKIFLHKFFRKDIVTKSSAVSHCFVRNKITLQKCWNQTIFQAVMYTYSHHITKSSPSSLIQSDSDGSHFKLLF